MLQLLKQVDLLLALSASSQKCFTQSLSQAGAAVLGIMSHSLPSSPCQILYARDVDQRSTTFEKSIHMGKEFQRRAKAMILRAAVLRNQIHVKVA